MKLLSASLLITLAYSTIAKAEPDTWAYFGCIGKEAPGVYVAAFDSETGELGEPRRLTETDSSNFLAIHPDGESLYVVSKGEEGGNVGGYIIDAKSGDLREINAVSIGSKGACHVSLTPDGHTMATADYGAGIVASFAVDDEGRISEVVSLIQHEGSSINESRQAGPHAHCTVPSPDGKWLVSADLGADKVFVYEVGEGGAISPHESQPAVDCIPGGGPRHFAFHPTAPFAYTNLELTSEITPFAVEGGKFVAGDTVSTLPEQVDGNSTSELLVHPSGGFIYCANRGHNSIAAFAIDPHSGALSAIGHASCGGEIPRNFGITPAGDWIVTCNQNSGNAGVLRIAEDGTLTTTEYRLDLPKPMCVRFVPMTK